MSCFHPVSAWFSNEVNPSGKRSLVFNIKERYKGNDPRYDKEIKIPCGRCVGCKGDKQKEWAVRILSEQITNEHSYFLTLTYNDKYRPVTESGLPTLDKKRFQDFLKRLRKKFGKCRIRFFQCGEYGEKNINPHHHMILFGPLLYDNVEITYSEKTDYKMYINPRIQEVWSDPKTKESYGFHTVGALTPESALYCAKYATKKLYGELRDKVYGDRIPEYATMSNRPGLGHDFIKRYYKDVYNQDKFVVKDGFVVRPPKFFDDFYKKHFDEHFEEIQLERREYAIQHEEPDWQRTLAKEQYKKLLSDRKKERSIK